MKDTIAAVERFLLLVELLREMDSQNTILHLTERKKRQTFFFFASGNRIRPASNDTRNIHFITVDNRCVHRSS